MRESLVETANSETRPELLYQDVETVRSELLNLAIKVTALAAVLSLIPSLHRGLDVGFQNILIFHVAASLGIVVVAIFRRRLTFQLRAFALIGLLFLTGAYGLFSWGLVGMGIFFLVMCNLLAAIFVSFRLVAVITVAGLVVILAIWTGVRTGIIVFNFDVSTYAVASSSWFVALVGTGFFTCIVVFTLDRFHKFLTGTITQLNNRTIELQALNHRLEAEIANLEKAEQALKESEQKYRLLAENVSDVIWTSDLGLKMTYISPSVEGLYGWTTAELQSLDLSNYLPPASMERALTALQEEFAIQEAEGANLKRVTTLELEQYRKDGSIFWTEVLARFLLDERQSPIGIIGVTRDISDRKRAEEQLRQERELTDALFESVPGLLYLYDEDWRLVRGNKQHEKLMGYSTEEMQGMNVLDWFDGSESSTYHITRKVQEIITSGSTETEANLITKDGRAVPYYFTGVRVSIGGKPYFTGIGVDITERKKTEETLWHYKRALDSSTDQVAAVDKDYRYVFANKAYLEYHKLDQEQVTEHYLSSVVGEETFLQNLRPLIDRCLKGEDLHFEMAHTYPSVGLTYLELWFYPLRDEGGKILGVVGIARDITKRKQLEDQLLQAQKMEAIGTLAGGIAHDFNNLLHVIQGYADIALLDLKKGQTGYSELHEVKSAAKGAAELTRGLLTFSRHVDSKLRPIDVNSEIRQLNKMLSRVIPKMIDIRLKLGDGLYTINGDPAQLQQLIMNLSVNARDAMTDGGTLTIETQNVELDEAYCRAHLETTPGKYVMVTVTDTGPGIDKNTMERIFEPFFTTKERGGGTGLGLSIVYGIARNHGGNILCYSEPGQGTTFKTYFPAIQKKHVVEEAATRESFVGGVETILLVDDEDRIRNLGKQILDRFGYSVITASNGIEGLDLFRKQKERIDLVILDLVMPGMGGRECLKEILQINPNAIVLIASGYAANGQISMSLEEGAKASIRKPYEARQLLETVRTVLDDA